MYSRTTLGNYYPVNSLVHKLNPVNKIFCLVLYILFIILSMSLKLHLIIFAFLVLIMLLSKVPFKFYFNIIFSLRYILVLAGILMIMFTLTPDVVIVILLKVVWSMASKLRLKPSLPSLERFIKKYLP